MALTKLLTQLDILCNLILFFFLSSVASAQLPYVELKYTTYVQLTHLGNATGELMNKPILI